MPFPMVMKLCFEWSHRCLRSVDSDSASEMVLSSSPRRSGLSLICASVDALAWKPQSGLGQLAGGRLASLADSRSPVSVAGLALTSMPWSAFEIHSYLRFEDFIPWRGIPQRSRFLRAALHSCRPGATSFRRRWPVAYSKAGAPGVSRSSPATCAAPFLRCLGGMKDPLFIAD